MRMLAPLNAIASPCDVTLDAKSRRRLRLPPAAAGILVALVCVAPYLNTAYTSDEPMFMLSGRQVLQHPLQPWSFTRCWESVEPCGMIVGRVGAGATQSLMSYMLVPAALLGGVEWPGHLINLAIACIGVAAMVALVRRMGFNHQQQMIAGLILVAIPPFLPYANTIMPDTAAMTFGLIGIERILAYKQEAQTRQGIAAGVALALAGYARPHGVLFIGLAALWLLDDWRPIKVFQSLVNNRRLWVPVVLATSFLVAVNLVTMDHSSISQPTKLLLGSDHWSRNIYAYLLYLSFPIPFSTIWLGVQWRRRPMNLVLPAIPVLIQHFFLFPSKPLYEDWPKFAIVYSIVALIHLIWTVIAGRDRLTILLTLWILIPLPLVIYDHLPIKYMTVSMPAIVLLALRGVEECGSRWVNLLQMTGIVGLTLFSLLVIRADASVSNTARRAAAELIASRVQKGEPVYFGGIGGFYWYASEAGARVAIPGAHEPGKGDLLVVATWFDRGVLRRFPNRELVESRHYPAPFGRTSGGGGGLHGNFEGDSIWVWNPEFTSDYELWRIK